MKCCILGSGIWGTVLANILAVKRNDVVIYGIEEKDISEINTKHHKTVDSKNSLHLNKKIKATLNIDEAIKDADLILIAVPSQAVRSVVTQIKDKIENKSYIVTVTKGFEPKTNERLSDIIRSVIPEDKRSEVVSLLGPSFAKDVFNKCLTCITATCRDEQTAQDIQKIFSNDYFKIHTQKDEIGAEICAATKNVIAIACGIVQGLYAGDNPGAAIITEGLKEISNLGIKLGAEKETFTSLVGIGDLVLTCTSIQSRNKSFGYLIGAFNSLEKAKKVFSDKTVEGVNATKSTHELAIKYNVKMPIVDAVYDILYASKEPDKAIGSLVRRHLK